MIILFSVNLGWLPPSGFGSFKQLIMPALALGMQSTAVVARMTRSSMLEVIRQDYIRTSRAKGRANGLTIMRHALGNAQVPIVTVIGIRICGFLAGAVLVETVFAIPGLGKYIIDSVNFKDYPVFRAACSGSA